MKYGMVKIQMTTSPHGNIDGYISRIKSAHISGADIILFSRISAEDGYCLTDGQLHKIARAVAPGRYAVLCTPLELDGYLHDASIVLGNGRILAAGVLGAAPSEILIGKFIVTASPSLYIKTDSGTLAVLGDCLSSADEIKKAASSADVILLSSSGGGIRTAAAAVKYYSDLYSCPILYCSGDSPANINSPDLKILCVCGNIIEEAYAETLTVDVDLEIALQKRSAPLYIDPAAAYVQATLPAFSYTLEYAPDIYPYIGNDAGIYRRLLDGIANRVYSEWFLSKKSGICLCSSIRPESIALILAASRACKKMSATLDKVTIVMPDYGEDSLPLTGICDYLGINYIVFNKAAPQEMTVSKCSDNITPPNKLPVPAPCYLAACGYADNLDALLMIPNTKSVLSLRNNNGYLETAFNPLFDLYSSAMLKLVNNIAAVSNSIEFAELLRQALKNTDPRKLAVEDFVIYHASESGFSIDKILFLAKHAFSETSPHEIKDIYNAVADSQK